MHAFCPVQLMAGRSPTVPLPQPQTTTTCKIKLCFYVKHVKHVHTCLHFFVFRPHMLVVHFFFFGKC